MLKSIAQGLLRWIGRKKNKRGRGGWCMEARHKKKAACGWKVEAKTSLCKICWWRLVVWYCCLCNFLLGRRTISFPEFVPSLTLFFGLQMENQNQTYVYIILIKLELAVHPARDDVACSSCIGNTCEIFEQNGYRIFVWSKLKPKTLCIWWVSVFVCVFVSCSHRHFVWC